MISLSTALSLLPFLGRKRLHGKRVYVFPHAIAERRVHELMLPHFWQAPETRAHDDGVEMPPIAGNFNVIALQTVLDALFDELGSHVDLRAELVAGADQKKGQQ
jgi:hypothetical protein